MGSEKTSVSWPQVCIGCGIEQPDMKDASYKWKSTESTSHGTKTRWTMRSMNIHAQLCDTCAVESKTLRGGKAAGDWTVWRMKLIFVLLIPTFLILLSTQMVPYVPSEAATMLPIRALGPMVYPCCATMRARIDKERPKSPTVTPTTAKAMPLFGRIDRAKHARTYVFSFLLSGGMEDREVLKRFPQRASRESLRSWCEAFAGLTNSEELLS